MLNIIVKRCDGRIFYFDELTNATVSPSVNYTEINAGWSLYPVAYLPGQSTFEMQITSGKFEADLFVMTNSTEFEQNSTYQMAAHETLTPNASGVVTLAHKPVAETISIWGGYDAVNHKTIHFTQTTANTPATGEYKLDVSGATGTLQFLPSDIGGPVSIDYYYEVEAREANIDNRSSAIGEAVLVYPVYGDADECKTDSSIIGHVIMKVYKCRVTAQPGLDGSYKTASTYQFSLSAMDAKRPDEATYSIAYIEA